MFALGEVLTVGVLTAVRLGRVGSSADSAGCDSLAPLLGVSEFEAVCALRLGSKGDIL